MKTTEAHQKINSDVNIHAANVNCLMNSGDMEGTMHVVVQHAFVDNLQKDYHWWNSHTFKLFSIALQTLARQRANAI